MVSPFGKTRQYIFFMIVALYTAIVMSCSNDGAGSRDAETLRFVFLADSRSNTHGSPPAPADMINTPVLKAINAQILALSPRPAFVIFGGDMAYRGHYKDSSTSFYSFQAWKDVMAPLTNAGIALYTIMGNHELYDTHAGKFILANQTEFQSVWSGNPNNGPAGYERLVYSFTSPGGSAFFAVLDPYYLIADVDDTLSGSIDAVQLYWLAKQVAQSRATHKFLFVHVPYYSVTGSSSNTTYTNLWTILDNNGFDIYFCGHSHLYSRKTIDSSILPLPQTYPPLPAWKNNVVQLLNGTCGAPVEPGPITVDPTLWHVSNAADTYYFSVVDIKGGTVTVTSYSGNTGSYSAFDTFTVQKNAPYRGDLLLPGR